MSKNINTNHEIYFYDDRSKHDCMMKLDKVLFKDNEVCLCTATWTISTALDDPQKILFNHLTGQVLNAEFDSWLATNDVAWAKDEDARLRTRALGF